MNKIVVLSSITAIIAQLSEEGVELPSRCETCKFVATEMQEALTSTGKNKEKFHLGSRFDSKPKIVSYQRSELRLIEVMEKTCPSILEYKMHKERKGSLRFSKGESQTMQTLKGLKDRGVKVDLGIPDDMWDEPGAEVSHMKKLCEIMLEEYDEIIEEWYMDERNFDKSLTEHLCEDNYLKAGEKECLKETWTGIEVKDGQENMILEEDKKKLSKEKLNELKKKEEENKLRREAESEREAKEAEAKDEL